MMQLLCTQVPSLPQSPSQRLELSAITNLLPGVNGAGSAGYTPPDGSSTTTTVYKPETIRGLSSNRLLGPRQLEAAAKKFLDKSWMCPALEAAGIDPQHVTAVRNFPLHLTLTSGLKCVDLTLNLTYTWFDRLNVSATQVN